jgi:hypothetical protein
LHNLNEALEDLERKALVTTAGTFVRLKDVKAWAEEREAVSKIERVEAPRPKNMNQAKRMVLKDEEIMKNFPPPRRELGRAIPAQQETRPVSRP